MAAVADAMSPTVGQSSSQGCATYCMGSQQFNGCLQVALDGGYFADDAGAPGAPALYRCYHDCTGRRPAALIGEPSDRARTAADALARAAYLEAAAVAAFRDLAKQVATHGAPPALVQALQRAARDEVRHARDVAALSRARGAQPPAVQLTDASPRSLFAIALENAREGCVRETWGAACAVVQSKRATDLEVRRTMRAIARDELRHAALSWKLAEWIAPHLTPRERVLVDEERARSLEELETELMAEPPNAWRACLGLPTRAEAQAILHGMRSELWERAA